MQNKFKKKRAPRRAAKKPTVALKKTVQKILNRNLETKIVSFFGPDSTQQQGVTADGTFAKVGFVAQNMSISSNLTDIKRMLPLLSLGTGRYERVGDSVRPVSLQTKIRISLNPTLWSQIGAGQTPQVFITTGATVAGRPTSGTNYADAGFPINDLTVVVYCLTHKTYKDYASLNSLNVFSELLDDGQGGTHGFGTQTAPFISRSWHGAMRINEAKYHVIKRFQTDLRKEMIIGGSSIPPLDPSNVVINNMAHKYAVELTCTLSQKELPAQLYYDVDTPLASSTDPTNFAPFWVVGCYNKANLPVGAVSPLWVTWVSTLKYKDA
jgi:hypothetical protein